MERNDTAGCAAGRNAQPAAQLEMGMQESIMTNR